jgi:hypothetical protein
VSRKNHRPVIFHVCAVCLATDVNHLWLVCCVPGHNEFCQFWLQSVKGFSLWSRLEITPSRRVSEPVNEDGPTLSQTVLPITAPAECRGAGTQPQVPSVLCADWLVFTSKSWNILWPQCHTCTMYKWHLSAHHGSKSALKLRKI